MHAYEGVLKHCMVIMNLKKLQSSSENLKVNIL